MVLKEILRIKEFTVQWKKDKTIVQDTVFNRANCTLRFPFSKLLKCKKKLLVIFKLIFSERMSHKYIQIYSGTRVTRLGHFEGFGENISDISSPNRWRCFLRGHFKIHHYSCKNCCRLLLGNFWKNSATFIPPFGHTFWDPKFPSSWKHFKKKRQFSY